MTSVNSPTGTEICDGTLDAIVVVAGLLNGLATEATINCATRLLDLHSGGTYGLPEGNSAFSRLRAPAATCPGTPSDGVTRGPRAIIVADAATPTPT